MLVFTFFKAPWQLVNKRTQDIGGPDQSSKNMAEKCFACKKIKLMPHGSEKQQSTTEIMALPEEVLIFIFKKVSLHGAVLNCSKVSIQWKDTVALGILKPAILKLANINEQFKETIKQLGLTKDCKDSDLILSLYGKYKNYSCKYF